MSHTCIRYMDDNTGRDVYIVKTKASNIELVNLTSSSYPKGKTIKNSGYYGMNASWYEEIKEGGDIYSCILNIAYQDGKPLGALSQYKYGQKNRVGDCLIYYKNGSVYYAEGVKDSSDSRVPKTSGSWAQGGMGLFLGNSNWLSLFRNQPMTTEDYSKGTAPRSGMVVNTNTKDVYLFAVPVASTDLISFRQIIMDYFGLKDGASNSYIRAILLDGGASTELYGNDFYAHTTIQHKIPQMISVGQA
ncbi:hypothetical protein LAWASA_1263 [Lawsonibacter asaccharolyticus]|uniref:hypothetical protein n=1 Tax=Clostridium sp. TaxID=1506 RepID=UPI000D2769F6|nr:hypothetical protein LAWASA_1263 [Lawsonibacter asaccharolyticus]